MLSINSLYLGYVGLLLRKDMRQWLAKMKIRRFPLTELWQN